MSLGKFSCLFIKKNHIFFALRNVKFVIFNFSEILKIYKKYFFSLIIFNNFSGFFLIFLTKFILLFVHFAIIIDNNEIGVEGAKAFAEMLKLNNNLTSLNVGKFFAIIYLNTSKAYINFPNY